MEALLFVIILILTAVVLLLVWKIHLMHRSMEELRSEFADRLKTDTNVGLSISSFDWQVAALARELDVQLKILRREKLRFQSGDRELKNAVTSISHDLRTPLTAILGYLDLLEQEELSKEAGESLQIIRNRALVMRDMTEELFRCSVILSGDHHESREAVVLNDALEACLAGFYGVLTEKGIRPEIEMPEKKICRTLNRKALERILSNIVSNAVKYSDGDLRVCLREDGNMIFSNHAAELDEIRVGNLFQRFFTVRTGENSTGLGLSIAENLTKEQGGSLKAVYKNSILNIYLYFS